MTISLTHAKKNKIKDLCVTTLKNSTVTICQLASFLGNIAASFEAVPYGCLHYRYLERNKIITLREARGNFENPCKITPEVSKDIIWWRDNTIDTIASLHPTPEVDLTIFIDVSNEGWGGSTNDQTINGRSNESEKLLHLNKIELLAIKHVVYSFLPLFPNTKHFRIMTDNSTSVSYINKQGSTHSPMCNKLTIKVSEICIQHLSHLSAAHIPGKHNVIADLASRKFQDSAEWMISTEIFDKLCSIFGIPDIDLFASRLNKQFEHYASWLPGLGSRIIDAMLVSWHSQYVYIFPPFSMIWPALKKCRENVKRH